MSQLPIVRLANDIAVQFHHLPPDQGSSEIANHINLFWHPNMRGQLLDHIAAGGADLDPLVTKAADQIKPA
jgi:formate dehydrogenase subunit delta